MSCTRTDAHPLGDCSSYTPRIEPVPGQYIEIESRSKRGTDRHVVLVTSVEGRGTPAVPAGEDYLYVGWRNAQPGGGWDHTAGQWGFFRLYPADREYGTSIIRVVPA